MFQTIRFIGLMAALLCHPGFGRADETPPAFAATQNLFDIPIEADDRVFAEALKHEDLTSPYNLAHPAEQTRYTILYTRKYSAYHPVPPGSLDTSHVVEPDPFNLWLPHDRDSNGRPLWFDGENGFLALTNIPAGLFYDRLYENLDRLYAKWNEASERTADGQWKLHAFDMPVPYYNTESHWADALKSIKSWQEKSPKSIAAALFEASYWVSYAWDARGQGYASAIPEDAWKLFKERLLKA